MTWVECQRSVQLTDFERKGNTDGSHVQLNKKELCKNNLLKDKEESAFNQKIDL